MIFVLRFIMITVLVVLKNNGINRLQRYEKIVSILPTETEKIIGKKTTSIFPIIYIMLNRNFYNRVNSNFLLIEYIHLLIIKNRRIKK